MDTTWPFNFDNPALARHLPAYYDILIIPKYFYEAVIKKDSPALNNLIKYNPISCLFNIVRSPIYGNSIPLFEYLYIFIFIIFGILLTYILLKKYSRRIPFWV